MREIRRLTIYAALSLLPLAAGCGGGGCGSSPSADDMGFNDATTGPCHGNNQHCDTNTDCCGTLTCKTHKCTDH